MKHVGRLQILTRKLRDIEGNEVMGLGVGLGLGLGLGLALANLTL